MRRMRQQIASVCSACGSKLLHCKKELAVFPSPAGMSLIKLFLGGNNLVFSRPERVWSVTSRLGTGKWLTLFYSVAQAAHTLANCQRRRHIRQHFASVGGACGSTLLAQTVHVVAKTKGYTPRTRRNYYCKQNVAYASKLLLHAPHTVALCQRRRRMRQLKQKGILRKRVEIITASKMLVNSYYSKHCFICRPSDSTVSEDAGIEPRPLALAARRSNHLARSHTHGQVSSTGQI